MSPGGTFDDFMAGKLNEGWALSYLDQVAERAPMKCRSDSLLTWIQ